jgi:hypothetical protein
VIVSYVILLQCLRRDCVLLLQCFCGTFRSFLLFKSFRSAFAVLAQCLRSAFAMLAQSFRSARTELSHRFFCASRRFFGAFAVFLQSCRCITFTSLNVAFAAHLHHFCSAPVALPHRYCGGFAALLHHFYIASHRFCGTFAALLQRFCSASAALLQRFCSASAALIVLQCFASRARIAFVALFLYSPGTFAFCIALATLLQHFCRAFVVLERFAAPLIHASSNLFHLLPTPSFLPSPSSQQT